MKIMPWIWKKLPRNTGASRAITSTANLYSSRLPNVESALVTWILSESFQLIVESIESGGLTNTDSDHVELFIRTTGLGLGMIQLDIAKDLLSFFYGKLFYELSGGENGIQIVAAKIDRVHDQVAQIRQILATPGLDHLPYRPSLAVDFGPCAITDQDRKAEALLDFVKGLVNKRRAGTALESLSTLQDQVEKGELSAPLRCRFFVNKGVSFMLAGKWDQAELELRRAETLEPKNLKALINLAQVLLFKGRPADAMSYLDNVLGSHPTESTANALRLACLHEIGDKFRIESILAAQPELVKDADCQYALASIAYDEGLFSEAERYLRQHNENDPSYPEAWELLGRLLSVPAQRALQNTIPSPNWIPESLKTRLEEAASCFTRAEHLLAATESPRELKVTLNNRGLTRMMLGIDEGARQDFERALQIDPSFDEAKRNLGNHFLNSGKPNEALQILKQITSPGICRDIAPLIAAAYLELNKPMEARAILEHGRDSGDEAQQSCLNEMLLVACQRLKDNDACRKIVQSLSSQQTHAESCRIVAEYYIREQDDERALIFAHLAVDAAKDANSNAARYRLLLADVFYRTSKFGDAADEYEQVQIPLDESQESRRRLIALFNAGRISKALEVAQLVRNSRPAIAGFSEIEALLFERIGDLDRATALRRELLSADISASHQKLRIAINLTRQNKKSDSEALTMEVDLSSITDNPESLHDAAMLRTLLELPDALAFAYHLLHVRPDDPDSHLFYIGTFFRREAIDKKLFHPEVVGLDCVVSVRHGLETRQWVVIDGESDLTKNWLSIRHDLVKEMLGKRVGEKFQFQRGKISETQYVIESLQSKYVRAFQDCVGRFNERFPDSDGFHRMDFDPSDLTRIALVLNQQREGGERIMEWYRSGTIPACSIARLFGKSDIEMFRSLAEERQIKVLSFNGAKSVLQAEETAILPKHNLILEASALVTLHSLGLLDKLSTAFDALWITQFTVDSLSNVVRGLFPEKATGYLYSDNPGQIRMVSRTPDEVGREMEFYKQLLHFLQTKCSIAAPHGRDGLEQFASASTNEVLGIEALATMAAALDTRYLLVSDDLPLRVLAQNESALYSVSTFALLRNLCSRKVLSVDEYHQAVQWLVHHRFSFVSVDKDDIVWVVDQNQWSPNPEVASFLECLTGPDCDKNDAIRVGLEVLHEISNRGIPPATQALISDLVINALVTGRNPVEVLNGLESANDRIARIWTPAWDRVRGIIKSWAGRFRGPAV